MTKQVDVCATCEFFDPKGGPPYCNGGPNGPCPIDCPTEGQKNWTELRAKMKEGYMPTAPEQLGAIEALARIFRDKGRLSDLLSWFGSTMDLKEDCDVFQHMIDFEDLNFDLARLLTMSRGRVDQLSRQVSDLQQQIDSRDVEIFAMPTQQDAHEDYAVSVYRLLVAWAANGDITQEMLITALTMKGA